MAAHIDRAVDKDLEIGVDLYDALVISFVPVVAAPGFIGYIFQFKIFIGRQLVMGQCTFAAFGNGCFKNSI